MRIKEIGKKVKDYDYRKLLNTRAFLIIGCVTLIGIAVLVSTLVNGGAQEVLDNESTKILGNSVLVDNNVSADDVIADNNNKDDFFAASVINRQSVRDGALDVLQQIVDNPDVLPDIKEGALNDIASMVDDMTAEANIETLIKAKGFTDCVAVISGNQCSVIVKSEGLLPNELAQIQEIVYEQCGIGPINTKVIEK